MGHALAAIALSAAILGWRAQIIAEFPDAELARSLNLVEFSEETALVVGLGSGLQPGSRTPATDPRDEKWIEEVFQFAGQANSLSGDCLEYKSIDFVHQDTCLSLEAWVERLARALPACGQRPANIEACAAEKE